MICYVCGKQAHKSYQCNERIGSPDQQPTTQANLTEQSDIIVVVVVEANMVENKSKWILDTSASRHFIQMELFYSYQDTANGECVFMGNSTTAEVLGKGKVFLKLTYDEILSLS